MLGDSPLGVVRKRRAGSREECDDGDRQLGYALQSDHCTLTGRTHWAWIWRFRSQRARQFRTDAA